jgi:hypothetical protein
MKEKTAKKMPGREACVVKAAPSEENTVFYGRNESKEDIKKRSNA